MEGIGDEMEIKILYDDSRLEVFSTSELTERKALGERNLLTNYEIRMDRIGGDKLWLETFWYDASGKVRADNPTGGMPTARRTTGWRFLLADESDMEHLIAVYLGEKLIVWRESGQLVFGALFNLQETLYFSDDRSSSVSRRAVFLHDYIARKHPDVAHDADAVCAEIGYPPDADLAMAEVEANDIRKIRDSRKGEMR